MNPPPDHSSFTRRPGPANRVGPQVRLHIDRLVLDGLPFNERQSQRLETSFTTELVRRIRAEPALATRLSERTSSQPVPWVSLPPGVSPEAAGRAFAQALLGSAKLHDHAMSASRLPSASNTPWLPTSPVSTA